MYVCTVPYVAIYFIDIGIVLYGKVTVPTVLNRDCTEAIEICLKALSVYPIGNLISIRDALEDIGLNLVSCLLLGY